MDLSLIDLPGITATTGGAEDNTGIELTKDLVRKTISKPSCLVLMTITMMDDYQNQIAVQFAKDADPKFQHEAITKSKSEDKNGSLDKLINKGRPYNLKVCPFTLDLGTIQSLLRKVSHCHTVD